MSRPRARILWVLAVVALSAQLGSAVVRWWTDERPLYAGQSTDERRRLVLEKHELDPRHVDLAARIARAWPADARYELRGRTPKSSYLEYLLAPRIPDPTSDRTIDVEAEPPTFRPEPADGAAPPPPGHPLGIVLAVATVFGLGQLPDAGRLVWIPVTADVAFLAILLFRYDIEWLVWATWPRLILHPLPVMIAIGVTAVVAMTSGEPATRESGR